MGHCPLVPDVFHAMYPPYATTPCIYSDNPLSTGTPCSGLKFSCSPPVSLHSRHPHSDTSFTQWRPEHRCTKVRCGPGQRDIINKLKRIPVLTKSRHYSRILATNGDLAAQGPGHCIQDLSDTRGSAVFTVGPWPGEQDGIGRIWDGPQAHRIDHIPGYYMTGSRVL
jgi:hypothetical protein